MDVVSLYHEIIWHDKKENVTIYKEKLKSIVDVMSKIMSEKLNLYHGETVDFECLLRPFYYLMIIQFSNASLIKPNIEKLSNREYSCYSSLSKQEECYIDGNLHYCLYNIAYSNNPVQTIQKYIKEYNKYITSLELNEGMDKSIDKEHYGINDSNKIAISLSLTLIEKFLFKLWNRSLINFLNLESYSPYKRLDTNLRSNLLNLLVKDNHVQAMKGLEYRLMIASVLTMPRYFIEDFQNQFLNILKKIAPMKAIVCGVEFIHKPQVAIGIALLNKKGGITVGSQHGGFYGQTDPTWLEMSERSIFNHYVTWGYATDIYETPLPSIRLSRFRIENILYKYVSRIFKYNKVLIVLPNITSLLSYSIFSPNILRQNDALYESLKLLRPLIYNAYHITMRMHPRNMYNDYKDSLPYFFNRSISWTYGKRGELIKDSQFYNFVLFTNPNATGISECVAKKIPFYIVANSNFYSFRQASKMVYDGLIKEKVWLTDESTVTKVLLSHKNYDWNKKSLYEFRKMFAYSSTDYIKKWSAFLKSLNQKS